MCPKTLVCNEIHVRSKLRQLTNGQVMFEVDYWNVPRGTLYSFHGRSKRSASTNLSNIASGEQRRGYGGESTLGKSPQDP